MKNTTIKCRIDSKSGNLDFYAECSGESRYIFTRKFRKTLFGYFKNGVSVYKLFELGRAHGNEVVINTTLQLREALKYLEKEYGIQIFDNRRDSSISYRRRKEYSPDLAA